MDIWGEPTNILNGLGTWWGVATDHCKICQNQANPGVDSEHSELKTILGQSK